MTSLFGMDWEAKQWEWENITMLNSKEAQIPKPTEWGIELQEGVYNGSLYSSGDGGYVVGERSGTGSGFAGSEVGFSSRSSKSASADSSSVDRISEFRLEEYEGFHGLVNNKEKLGNANQFGNSLILEASEKFGEPLIGLKLGKRTYFKDIFTGSNGKASSIPVNSMPSASTPKRHRSSSQSLALHCIVEGCNLDISSAKAYHRKHKICESHSKSSMVIVNGMERRFCQQCSRLHTLTEFDGKKRSCRKRLSNHNARRRKPQREIIQFNSSRIGSLLYDGRQQMALNEIPFLDGNDVASSSLENTCNSKFTLTKEFSSRPTKTRDRDGQMHFPNSGPPNAINITYHESKGYPPSKVDTAQVLNQGFEGSMMSTNMNEAQNLRRALSLLSKGSCEPQAALVNHRMAATSSRLPESQMNIVVDGFPLAAASETWLYEQSSELQTNTLTGENNGYSHVPKFQLFQIPYGSGS